jgi:hypothetical protein
MTYFNRATGHAVIALAVLAGAGVASAQTTVITREPVETRTVVTQEPLALSPTQRTTVYRTITRERVFPAQPTVEYRVGMRVPDTVQLYTVPDTVVTEVPTVRPYKYMTVNNRVWLVDPNTSQIVAEVAE